MDSVNQAIANLSPDRMRMILRHVAESLWLDYSDDGVPTWNPEREWSADTVDSVAEDMLALRPNQPERYDHQP